MVKMKFPRDMYYNDMNVPLYNAGKVYEIEDSMVTRWIKRGGEIVEDEKPQPKVEAPPKTEDAKQEPVEDAKEKAEDIPSKPAPAAAKRTSKSGKSK